MKHELRARMRSSLREIDPDDRRSVSLQICKHVVEDPLWREANTIFLYLATQREVDTTALVEQGWRDGRRVLAPRVDPESRSMQAVEIRSWSDCLPGFRGILEPLSQTGIAIQEIDLVVLPGLAFDASGRRLGQGGGYYDWFLARPDFRATTIGIAFDQQICDALPHEDHDRSVDAVATESGVRRPA